MILVSLSSSCSVGRFPSDVDEASTYSSEEGQGKVIVKEFSSANIPFTHTLLSKGSRIVELTVQCSFKLA